MTPLLFLLAFATCRCLAGEVYFSPAGGCTAAVVRQLGKATNSVWVQAYSFTSVPIARALVDANRRGAAVRVILDKSQRSEKYTSATFLVNAGVPCWIDDRHAIAHNKVMVIDGKTVITGSFNFSSAAEHKNAENLLILEDPALAARYSSNFLSHADHSMPYKEKTPHP